MSDKLRIKCPSCEKALIIPSNAVGKKGTCPACRSTFTIGTPGSDARKTHAREERPDITIKPSPIPAEEVSGPLLDQQPTHRDELARDRYRMMTAVSAAPDKYAIVEPFLMKYEQPVAIAVQRQFPFSLFADVVLLSSHRLLIFKRFFSKIDLFDVNYVDIVDVSVQQGYFTSALTVVTHDRRRCTAINLISDQALKVYRLCQDVETKARIARRAFQLEENRSRTTQMQVNNVLGSPIADPGPSIQGSTPRISHNDFPRIGDEESNPYRLGE